MAYTRRLQQTKDGSSFLITLPKDWVTRQGLGKGKSVDVTEREDGCLIIYPRLLEGGERKSTDIHIEDNLRWAITSKYLLGFDEIRIFGDHPITNSQRNEIKQIIKRFVALEVTDEEEDFLVLQCLVDPSTLPVSKAMRRMNLITSRMLRDATVAYFTGNRETAEEIIARDDEVDRLFFLIVRELRCAIQYPGMSEKMGITPVEALDFRLAAQYIERIADLAVDIAARTGTILDKKLVKRMEPIITKVKEMLETSVRNLLVGFDSEKVASVIRAEKELIEETSTLRQQIIAGTMNDPQTHVYVVDILLRIGEAAKDIVDLGLPKE